MNNNLKDYNFYFSFNELLYRSEGQDIEQLKNQLPENERIRYHSASLIFLQAIWCIR
jgi:type VI secretion system protein ImpH